MHFKKISLILLLFSTLANADNNSHYYHFLKKGFDINQYQQCQTLIRQCPVEGIFPKESCVTQVVQSNKVCRQLAKLSQVLESSPNQLYATQEQSFTLINMTFPADGQNNYYLISKGYLINTHIDPRTLDSNLAAQFKGKSFNITNRDKPQYQTNANGSQSFRVVLRITDTCLACPILGWATIDFNFTNKGRFLNAKLIAFQQKAPPN